MNPSSNHTPDYPSFFGVNYHPPSMSHTNGHHQMVHRAPSPQLMHTTSAPTLHNANISQMHSSHSSRLDLSTRVENYAYSLSSPHGNYSLAPGGYPAAPRYPRSLGDFGYTNFPKNGFHPVDRCPEVHWCNDGKMNAKELQTALFNGQGKHFSEGVCHIMITMFDRTRKTGTIDLREFQELYRYISNWMNIFNMYDKEENGFIEEADLYLAVQQMGYIFSNDFIKQIVSKCDTLNQKHVSADQFVSFCIQLQRFTEIFRLKDNEHKGLIYIGFEEYLRVLFACSP